MVNTFLERLQQQETLDQGSSIALWSPLQSLHYPSLAPVILGSMSSHSGPSSAGYEPQGSPKDTNGSTSNAIARVQRERVLPEPDQHLKHQLEKWHTGWEMIWDMEDDDLDMRRTYHFRDVSFKIGDNAGIFSGFRYNFIRAWNDGRNYRKEVMRKKHCDLWYQWHRREWEVVEARKQRALYLDSTERQTWRLEEPFIETKDYKDTKHCEYWETHVAAWNEKWRARMEKRERDWERDVQEVQTMTRSRTIDKEIM
ncbi:MAG: hypothetical protein M1827_001892 [Pycnora praestabilis]|nr:MAG: hypothetical protein M1827_001892 [Pycnora praestabilis]